MAKRVVVTMGLQFGSEGKGQLSGMIAEQWQPDVVVCANHPNAGHTYRNPLDRKFIHRILPVGAAVADINNVLIGPGAVIDLAALRSELLDLKIMGLWGSDKKLIIHPNAAVVTEEDREAEKAFVGIGSTMKGSAEAVIRKMRRPQTNLNTIGWLMQNTRPIWDTFSETDTRVEVSDFYYNNAIDLASKILVEGAQGFSLGIHERFYPYGTSRDVSVNQVLADCRIPAGQNLYVHGVVRTFPIRVANRFDADGKMIGTSGPCYGDQIELDWQKDLGREPELTTVTKLPRRIFSFSYDQVREAIRINRVNGISLTFCDYIGEPRDSTKLANELFDLAPVMTKSYGPKYDDVCPWNMKEGMARDDYPDETFLGDVINDFFNQRGGVK